MLLDLEERCSDGRNDGHERDRHDHLDQRKAGFAGSSHFSRTRSVAWVTRRYWTVAHRYGALSCFATTN
ncbi:hypothetical protein DF111_12900 [Burkholderia stagnalis]|nr:hypothetical protein DF119_31795 [Burkholderia stagnalis]RQY33422.1 hypothetical protein DF116_25010 [Burkholderia stagnalis]RQY56686.1 hypothetical protein DF111_12900 [Burkholderia stagnalis]RQY86494.1 hypothetical protein DF108_12715 [Burkholderia stagnalis]